MESFVRSINLKNFLFVIIISFMTSQDRSINGEILKKNAINEIDFENALNQNSVKFHEYENLDTLFIDFFGLGDPLVESSFNTNFRIYLCK